MLLNYFFFNQKPNYNSLVLLAEFKKKIQRSHKCLSNFHERITGLGKFILGDIAQNLANQILGYHALKT